MNKKRIISVVLFFSIIAVVLIISAINYRKNSNNTDETEAETFLAEENENIVDENTVEENEIAESTTESNVQQEESTEQNNITSKNQINNNQPNKTESNKSKTTTTQSKSVEEKKPTAQTPYNLDSSVFLIDFQNYNPGSNEVKISETKARSIAQKGFDESKKRIAGEGADDKASETVKIETIAPNNYFTRQGREYDQAYTNKKRKCYIVSRENDMGNGIKIYVDVTTGLIVGGSAFGD